MSDLVGTPEDRFSHVAAHLAFLFRADIHDCLYKNAQVDQMALNYMSRDARKPVFGVSDLV